jgi:hypothetical protein
MEARRLRAGSLVFLAAVVSMLLAAPAHADPEPGGTGEPPAGGPSTGVPTPDPTGKPTQAPPTTQAPPSPTAGDPPPVHRFKMTTSAVTLGERYWQGDGAAELVISIKNTGERVGRETVTGFYAFPTAAQATGAYGTGGCAVDNGFLSFSCALGEQALGQVVIRVDVDPDAWRTIATGLVTAAIGPVQRTAPIAFAFGTPPTPGIGLEASVPVLPAGDTAQLSVRLHNTGSGRGAGAIEIVTPPGIDLVVYPTACRSHRRISADRDRCELGDLAGGREVSAVFGLTVGAAARAELPLTGAVHGYLAPAGRGTVQTRHDFEISAPPPPAGAEAPLPTSAPASPAARPGLADLRWHSPPADDGQRSSLPYIGAVVGLVTVLGVLVVLSLRRRMRDDEGALAPDEVEDVVLVPAGGAETPLTRAPIPRAPAVARRPGGPRAGPDFRPAEPGGG